MCQLVFSSLTQITSDLIIFLFSYTVTLTKCAQLISSCPNPLWLNEEESKVSKVSSLEVLPEVVVEALHQEVVVVSATEEVVEALHQEAVADSVETVVVAEVSHPEVVTELQRRECRITESVKTEKLTPVCINMILVKRITKNL